MDPSARRRRGPGFRTARRYGERVGAVSTRRRSRPPATELEEARSASRRASAPRGGVGDRAALFLLPLSRCAGRRRQWASWISGKGAAPTHPLQARRLCGARPEPEVKKRGVDFVFRKLFCQKIYGSPGDDERRAGPRFAAGAARRRTREAGAHQPTVSPGPIFSPMRPTRRMLVVPGTLKGTPAVMTICSPSSAKPSAAACLRPLATAS